jgi:hypothetical protein
VLFHVHLRGWGGGRIFDLVISLFLRLFLLFSVAPSNTLRRLNLHLVGFGEVSHEREGERGVLMLHTLYKCVRVCIRHLEY